MSVKYQCDKCKEYRDADEVVALKYSKLGVGEFHTIHLCDTKCRNALESWLNGDDEISNTVNVGGFLHDM